MMRVVVTGAAGFIGTQLSNFLRARGQQVTEIDLAQCDIRDTEKLRAALAVARPEQIYHLAAQPNVRDSWRDPVHTWQTNVFGTLSLFEAIRTTCPTARTLIMSSASIFDGTDIADPITEDMNPVPRSPYGASKLAGELIAQQHRLAYQSQTITVRPFNIIGPTQSAAYVVPSLAQRVLNAIETDERHISVGNLRATRDFLNIRDAVRGLHLLMNAGEPGETYNLCTGAGHSIQTVIETLISLADFELTPYEAQEHQRAHDAMKLTGDPRKNTAQTGWRAEISLRETLSEVLTALRAQLTSQESRGGE